MCAKTAISIEQLFAFFVLVSSGSRARISRTISDYPREGLKGEGLKKEEEERMEEEGCKGKDGRGEK